MRRTRVFLWVVLCAGCGREGASKKDAEAEPSASPPTNRIGIPVSVRENLGITFAKVERRPVRRTLRVPGQFELLPEARREYHAMLPGRVQLHVRQLQAVEKGTPLLTLDSPQWRKTQHEVVEAAGQITLAEAAHTVAEAKLAETQKAVEFIEERITKLTDLGVRRVTLESELAGERNKLPRLRAEVEAARATRAEAHEHYESQLNTLSSVTGLSVATLAANDSNGRPYWKTIETLEIRAETAGIVDRVAVTNGGWIETGGLALTTADPRRVRFHARAPQADLPKLKDGQDVRIVPPQGGALHLQDSIPGSLKVGFRARPAERTVPLYVETSDPAWAKPGVTAYLEVVVAGEDEPETAIPLSCVVRDGLQRVFFRRDPDDPDQAIRIEADLGIDDGRWVVVHSGVLEGDEIVLDGVYELKLAMSSTGQQKGGHFHADGTFHEGED